jgi:proline iminopeptidase
MHREREHEPMHRPAGRSAVACALLLLSACGAASTEAPGALVPPTADEDPALPQVSLVVGGHSRAVHVRTFGDPASPVLLVLHGGPGADFRLMLPLAALADRHHVVMWDQRGAGLSERVPEEELTLDAFDEEIAAIHARFAPGRRISLVGHSFGGDLALRYAARHPDRVDQLALVEPGPFDRRARAHYDGGQGSGSVLDGDLHEILWMNEVLSPSDHAAMDYRLLAGLRASTSDFYCAGQAPREYVLWRWGAYALHVLNARVRDADDGLDWSDGIAAFPSEVLVIAGSCGDAGAEFQRRYNLPLLPSRRLVEISGAGHLTLFTDHAPALLDALRAFLGAYR